MPYSIKQMEDRIENLRQRRTELASTFETCSTLFAVGAIDDALLIIAELAGRLSAAETLLADVRKPKQDRNYREAG